jgi:UDP-N-acetylglucosamine 1-carboxyvinyltransferase
MTRIVVHGGRRLAGRVPVSGSKNAALPLLFASLLTRERCTIRGLPRVADITTTLRLLEKVGCLVGDDAFEAILVEARDLTSSEAPYELVKTMRASFLTLGPLVARTGYARVSTPGGCAIGSRPVDIHLAGLERMGATIRQSTATSRPRPRRLRGARIALDFPRSAPRRTS